MFPSHLDGGFHTIGQDDELRRPAVIMGAKAYNVDLSHSGRKIARKSGESKGVSMKFFPKGRSIASGTLIQWSTLQVVMRRPSGLFSEKYQLQNGYIAWKALPFSILTKAHGINNPDAILSPVLIFLLSFIAAESQPYRLNRVGFAPSAVALL
jgi:hypothetical protein